MPRNKKTHPREKPETERLLAIVNLLKEAPHSIQELHEKIPVVSDRQIRRDVEAIEKYFAPFTGHRLIPELPRPRNCHYSLIHVDDKKEDSMEAVAYRLMRLTTPQIVSDTFGEEIERMHNRFRDVLPKGETGHSLVEMSNTHFGEAHFSRRKDKVNFRKKIQDLLQAIDNRKKVNILNYTGDPTSLPAKYKQPQGFIVLPLRILYHRGRFYLGCRLEQENRYLFLDLTYLGNISVRTQSFHLRDKLEKLNQAKQALFGITENATPIQRVVIEFSSETGDFVRHTIWDALGVNAQNLEIELVGKSQPYNWRMSFDCGINRELVGWIFSWMSNVRVIQPASLRKKVQDVAQRMIDVNSGKIYLRYENLFPALP